jgi:hypothetical protein
VEFGIGVSKNDLSINIFEGLRVFTLYTVNLSARVVLVLPASMIIEF